MSLFRPHPHLALAAILLLVAAAARAQIDISVSGGAGLADAKVSLSGSSVSLISPSERAEFQLTEWQLLSAVEKLSGGRPAEAYVGEPTTWRLYPTYNWHQVQRVLRPVKAKIVQLKSSPVTVTTKFFDNRSFAGKATFQGSVSLQKKNTFTSTWSSATALSLGQEITFSFNIGVASFESSTSFEYATSWGKDSSQAQTTTLGSESGIELELEGGRAAVALLSATRGELVLEVEYEALVVGQVAANYPGRYRDHYFWAYDVRALLAAAGQPHVRRSKQTVRVGFYSDDTVAYYDHETGEPLPSAAVSKK
ncbi:hypothetical protein MSG28_015664 [Choristoneura fumiferana]|uniref:Uncharacterized protein n=1 Tax=Choristoneura fumiferana TaxID=7141 RepID=A0ACC0KC74_CHOFU|nr:hypothetical protein MSG28_015664 [Choristoneura fumiferana]